MTATPPWEILTDSPQALMASAANDTATAMAANDTTKQLVQAQESEKRLTCLVYDEEMAEITLAVNHGDGSDGGMPEVLKDTDAFARQGDKGPYHWAQGPQDALVVHVRPEPPPTPPVANPSPNPESTKPGFLPRKGQAVTVSNLRLRKGAGITHPSLGVIPTGTTITLTGGRRRVEGALWVRVHVAAGGIVTPPTSMREPDAWLSPPSNGWVNSEFIAIPASEYVAADFPPVTHAYLWWLDDPGGLEPEMVRRTLTAITDDPRGPLRAGLDLREATSAEEAHVLVRLVDDACSGAAGCYYKRSGEKARVDIAKQWFNTAWLSRVWLHECMGHAVTRAYDHYNGAPQYPRPDYYGIMGNWQDHYGDHAWPDEDDMENFRQWLAGASDLVFVRDVSDPAG